MAMWQPDPSFYPSPRQAAKAPAETLAYVAAFDPARKAARRHRGRRCRSEIRVLFEDHRHGQRCQCGRRIPPLRLERLLVVPVPERAASRMSSGAISWCRACVPRASTSSTPSRIRASRKLVKTIEPEEIAEKTGYTRPHTVHCGPGGIYVAALGDKDGKAPGGVFVMDHESFEPLGPMGGRSRATAAGL